MAQDFIDLKKFDKLIENTLPVVKSFDDFDEINYFSSKGNVLRLISEGYEILPSVYHKVFLDPFKNLVENYYEEIQGYISRVSDGPFREWLDSIYQHKTGYLKRYTQAFEECCADIYDGFLSMEERIGVKPPDYQKFAPLVRWGGKDIGPYTWPATGPFSAPTTPIMNMSVVSLPPAYSRNIALWSANGHEVAGHDVLHADEGLLNELEDIVVEEINSSDALKNTNIEYYGRKTPLSQFAGIYWRHTMDEAASDVLGILNIGPAAGLGHALVFISFTEAGSGRRILRKNNPVAAVHPISALRILLAVDVIRNLPQFDNIQSKKWADTLEDLVDKYTDQRDNFELYIRTGTDPPTQVVANIPYGQMRETVKIVAKTVALRPLKQLDGHSFNEINTWSTSDEILVQRIATDLLENREPSIESLPHEVQVYAAHILAGSVIALAGSADVYEITENAVSALNKLYKQNSVFRGLPFTFRSDIYRHRLVTDYDFLSLQPYELKTGTKQGIKNKEK